MNEDTRKALELAKAALDLLYINDYGGYECSKQSSGKISEAESAIDAALSAPAAPVAQPAIGPEWLPCVKLPITVHVRAQRPGESHVSTREGLTPVRPDDLIMRGAAGEEYPIGRELFDRTYRIGAPAAPVASSDWRTPTTWVQRFTDAIERMCGKRPADGIVAAWLDKSAEDDRLQDFCAEHGPAWAQGIVVLDAAAILADTPAEGADHAPAPAAPVARVPGPPFAVFDEFGRGADDRVQDYAARLVDEALASPAAPVAQPLTREQIADAYGWKPGLGPSEQEEHDARVIERICAKAWGIKLAGITKEGGAA